MGIEEGGMCPGASPSGHSQSLATTKRHLQKTLGWATQTQDASPPSSQCHSCSVIYTIYSWNTPLHRITAEEARDIKTDGKTHVFHYVCVCDITTTSILRGRCVPTPLITTSLAPCCPCPGTLCSFLCLPSFSSCCLVDLGALDL